MLSQNGLNYICENFGDVNLCCVRTGLSWYYTLTGIDYPETGGTAQIVSRLASGLIDSLTMTSPARGTFTQAELNTANNGSVTIEDAHLIAEHDDVGPLEQWCFGAEPPPSEIPWVPIIAGLAIAAATVGVVVWKVKKK